jgi:hypothetical protein
MEYLAIYMTKMYNMVVRVPRWIMLLVSGSIASFAINMIHGFGKKPAPPKRTVARPATAAVVDAPAPVAPVPAAAAPASPSKAKQRKGKGKK